MEVYVRDYTTGLNMVFFFKREKGVWASIGGGGGGVCVVGGGGGGGPGGPLVKPD